MILRLNHASNQLHQTTKTSLAMLLHKLKLSIRPQGNIIAPATKQTNTSSFTTDAGLASSLPSTIHLQKVVNLIRAHCRARLAITLRRFRLDQTNPMHYVMRAKIRF
jgi:hypothetical protein